MKKTNLAGLAALAVCTPLLAAGQTAPRTEATALRHSSAFADYQPYRDIEPGDWRGLNDAVGAAALKPVAQQATAAAAAAATAARPAMPMPSAGPKGMQHGMHGHDKMHGGRK